MTLKTQVKSLLARMPRSTRGTLVICVHRISDDRAYGSCEAERLDTFLHVMRATGRQVVRLVDADPTPSRIDAPRAAIIFDDAYRSVFGTVMRLLEEGTPVAVAVPTGRLHGQPIDGLLCDEVMDREELISLVANGAELVPHGDRHVPLTTLTPQQAVADIATSVARVQELTGERPNRFVFPFGATSPQVARALEHVGVQHAYGTRQGVVTSRSPRLHLPRFTLASQTTVNDLAFVTSGWYGARPKLRSQPRIRR